MPSNTEIAKEIEEVVRGWWDKHQAPVLLSKLGSLLSSDVQSTIQDEKIGLKRFISAYCENLRLLEMGRHGGGVAPLEKSAGRTEEELERAFESQRKLENVGRIPSYDSLVWRAFRSPISNGERRFLKIDPNERVELRQIESSDEGPNDPLWFEVKADDIPKFENGIPATAREIHDAIKAWSEGKVELDHLIKLNNPKIGDGDRKIHKIQRESALDLLLNGLRIFSRDELARINVPADVLLSVLERSRR